MLKVTSSEKKTIQVKYLPPTNSAGARLKAFVSTKGERIVLPWSYELNNDENYCLAAKTLAEKLDWKGKLVGGFVEDNKTVHMVFVFVD